MKGALTETARSAADQAKRFRLLQSSFADDAPESRRRVLQDELDQILKSIPFGKRKEFLESLSAEFPVPEAGASSPAPKNNAPSLPDDPGVVVEHLINLANSLPPEKFAEISRRLQQSGLAPAPAGPGHLDVPQELAARISKLSPSGTIDPQRALRSLDILIEFILSLDQIVWEVWKNIAPKSVLLQEHGAYRDFRRIFGAYVTGDTEISTEQIKQNINKTRRLASGLMAAMGALGELHARKLAERLSPEEIQKASNLESGSILDSTEKKCWRRYNAIYSVEMNPEAMEKELLEIIRKYTEKLVFGPEAADQLEK